MSKSADETAEVGEPLDEDSDVIELTDEVPAADTTSEQQEASPDDELDALTREMPEFRVPDGSEESNKVADTSENEPIELRETVQTVETGAPAAIPNAAIISGRGRSSNKGADRGGDKVADTEGPSDDGGADDGFASDPEESASEADQSSAEVVESGDEIAYDRQAMVKTIQMDAIDRREFERSVQAGELDDTVLLEDQSYAPDVLVFPPRVLTTRWKEGGPLLRAGRVSLPDDEQPADAAAESVEESRNSAPEEVAEPAEEQSKGAQEAAEPPPQEVEEPVADAPGEQSSPPAEEALDGEDLPEIEPDAVELELDSPEIEDAEVKPPPKPKDMPPQKRPSKPAAGERKPAGEPQPGQPVAKEEDEELSGLVQELLDESKQGGSAKKAKKPQSPRQTWFKNVFTEEYLRTLPRDIHRQTRREADFIEESFALGEDDRVLDLACGFGRHAIELTRRGHEVAGLDLSMPLLQKALNEAKKQSLSIKFIHGDMRELNFEAIFNACYLWQTSFGYFDEQTNFRVLRGIHRALAPKGRLLIDVLNRDHIAAEMPHRLWWEGVDCVFLEEVDLDHKTSVLHTKRSFIYEDGSPPLEQNTFIRVYSLHELVHLLEAAGFAVREVSGELHQRGHFLGPASSRIIILAQKKPPRRKRG